MKLVKTVYNDLFEDEVSEILENMSITDRIDYNGKSYFKSSSVNYDGIIANDTCMFICYENRSYVNKTMMIDFLYHHTFTLCQNV